MKHFNIIPECYADTLLVEMLGFVTPNHKLGIGEVMDALAKKFINNRAVGIIDNDKKKPTDFKEFDLVEECEGLQRRLRANTQHTIIVITPAFENWVFQNAAKVDVDPQKYGFKTAKIFRSICKRQDANQNQNLKQFINTLKQKNAPGFQQLKTWIADSVGIPAEEP